MWGNILLVACRCRFSKQTLYSAPHRTRCKSKSRTKAALHSGHKPGVLHCLPRSCLHIFSATSVAPSKLHWRATEQRKAGGQRQPSTINHKAVSVVETGQNGTRCEAVFPSVYVIGNPRKSDARKGCPAVVLRAPPSPGPSAAPGPPGRGRAPRPSGRAPARCTTCHGRRAWTCSGGQRDCGTVLGSVSWQLRSSSY